MRKDLHEENRLSWNAATVAHNSHKGDQAAFFRNGGSTLRPEELGLLGDVKGLSIVHLQCNAGRIPHYQFQKSRSYHAHVCRHNVLR